MLSGLQFSGRILLVEDNPDNQRVLSYHLRRLGLEFELAENGLIAVEKAMSSTFDLILMDMQMPVLDGYGATSSLRRANYNRPIIALTAHAMKEDRDRCLRVGCDEYLTKPLDLEQFLKILTNYLAPGEGHPPAVTSQGQTLIISPIHRKETGAIQSLFQADPSLRPMIREYIEGLPQRVSDLWASLRSSDLGRLESLAHQTKGVGGMYGFPGLTEIAALIEDAVREGHETKLLEELVHEFAEHVHQIRLGSPDLEA